MSTVSRLLNVFVKLGTVAGESDFALPGIQDTTANRSWGKADGTIVFNLYKYIAFHEGVKINVTFSATILQYSKGAVN